MREILNKECTHELVLEYFQRQIETKSYKTKEKVTEIKPIVLETRKNSAESIAMPGRPNRSIKRQNYWLLQCFRPANSRMPRCSWPN